MITVRTIPELRAAIAAHPGTGRPGKGRPAFVPTMGNLHDGHIALVRQARPLGDVLVASIFVNRLQFLPHEDFDSYPRTWEADCAKLEAAGCDIVFAPRESDLYPEPQTFKLQPDPQLADILEGHFRPGFFTGVCTVVMKLFSAVFFASGGGTAVFGKKDYQQLMVIRRMVAQMALPIEIVGGETSRSEAGLALSSRNGYLSDAEREEALTLIRLLRGIQTQARAAQVLTPALLQQWEDAAMAELRQRGWAPDYVMVRRQKDLHPATPEELAAGLSATPLVTLVAAKIGNTRLIDNLEV